MNLITKSFKAIRCLGLPKLWHYTVYQIGLHSGHYRRLMPSLRVEFTGAPALAPLTIFPRVSKTLIDSTISEAETIRRGYVRLFGGEPVQLDLAAGASKEHWSKLAKKTPDRDIKRIWEPGRFGWAVTLARAHAFTGDPVYSRVFWKMTHQFLNAHPPNLGLQWQSAQEVAIRLMALVFCDRVFAAAPSSNRENRKRLWQAIAEHAQRIPPTLVYARAQNNNHLLSEAAGLYTAGLYLPGHPQAEAWRKTGWHWLNYGLQHQIGEFGTYIQHSTNYHRLMLQLALYTDHVRRSAGEPDWPLLTRTCLSAAARWLWALTDPQTGRVPNLGANDSAYIFPLTHLPFDDHRPVVDASVKAFLNQDIYEQPEIAEMAEWFDHAAPPASAQKQPHAPDMLRVEGKMGRAFLHTAYFFDRPSHADQLHTDLWWRGVNVAQDTGTYRYTAAPPWNNALASAHVHNTVTLDGHDQMLPAGRFLWLDWAQAQVLAQEINDIGQVTKITAVHDGYHKYGATHQRTLMAEEDGWVVLDEILPYGQADNVLHKVQVTWLLPDWVYEITDACYLYLMGPVFSFHLHIDGADQLALYRGGECVMGEMAPQPTWGWASPIYGQKQPALMLVAARRDKLPVKVQSTWHFDK